MISSNNGRRRTTTSNYCWGFGIWNSGFFGACNLWLAEIPRRKKNVADCAAQQNKTKSGKIDKQQREYSGACDNPECRWQRFSRKSLLTFNRRVGTALEKGLADGYDGQGGYLRRKFALMLMSSDINGICVDTLRELFWLGKPSSRPRRSASQKDLKNQLKNPQFAPVYLVNI